MIKIYQQWAYINRVYAGFSLFEEIGQKNGYFCCIGKSCLDAFVEKMDETITNFRNFREKNKLNDRRWIKRISGYNGLLRVWWKI